MNDWTEGREEKDEGLGRKKGRKREGKTKD